MAASAQYQYLVRDHARIRRDLLPITFDPNGDYPDKVLTATLAYRVLSHAEIESYLEDRALEAALTAVKAWKDRRKSSKTLLSLIAFSGQEIESPPNTIDLSQPTQRPAWEDKIKLSERIEAAMKVFSYAVKNNHGIKEDNMHRLLLPIGIEFHELDPVLMADVNSFAEERGEVAHLSAGKYRTKQQIDPKDELTRVKSIIARLIDIDRLIDKLLLEIT